MTVRVVHGDMLAELPKLAAEGFRAHACVTDPPYHLTSIVKRFGSGDASPVKVGKTGAYARASAGFMGQQWDGGDVAFRAETWRTVLDCMLPGAHLVAFGGTRTFHRMAVAIEDAGFEIKDTIMYLYGTGFPKSHNLDKHLHDDQRCLCHRNNLSYRNEKERSSDKPDVPELRESLDAGNAVSGCAEQGVFQDVRGGVGIRVEIVEGQATGAAQSEVAGVVRSLPDDVFPQHEMVVSDRAAGLLPPMQREVARSGMGQAGSEGFGCSDTGRPRTGKSSDDRQPQPRMEGRRDLQAVKGELQGREIGAVPCGPAEHDDVERLHHGAPAGDGAMGATPVTAEGSGAPSGSRPAQQRAGKSGIVAEQSGAQDGGAWPLCERCGKPRIPSGLGTALKPAFEPIIVARKPLDGTVAANTLKHGCGGLNIDGCRVGIDPADDIHAKHPHTLGTIGASGIYGAGRATEYKVPAGRWPANVIHDGSDEVEAAFAAFGEGRARGNVGSSKGGGGMYGHGLCTNDFGAGDTGTASRFFFCAKADASDRAGSKHPTIKPTALMRWLVQLVTPPGGTVLDPFAGSGSTGLAADQLGFNAVLIEREEQYATDARRKIAADAPLLGSVA